MSVVILHDDNRVQSSLGIALEPYAINGTVLRIIAIHRRLPLTLAHHIHELADIAAMRHHQNTKVTCLRWLFRDESVGHFVKKILRTVHDILPAFAILGCVETKPET